jgi:hypothetical protein
MCTGVKRRVMLNSKMCQFANEVPQDTDGQRQFENHNKEVHILCNEFEDDYPVGRILITPEGIRIELGAN